jgi:hypothetical protein
MIWILWLGAHVGGADVEQVFRIAGVIGQSAPNFRTPFDQRHPKRPACQTQQLIREEYAARAAADNDRMPLDHLTQPRLQPSLTVVHKRGDNACRSTIDANDEIMPSACT